MVLQQQSCALTNLCGVAAHKNGAQSQEEAATNSTLCLFIEMPLCVFMSHGFLRALGMKETNELLCILIGGLDTML